MQISKKEKEIGHSAAMLKECPVSSDVRFILQTNSPSVVALVVWLVLQYLKHRGSTPTLEPWIMLSDLLLNEVLSSSHCQV